MPTQTSASDPDGDDFHELRKMWNLALKYSVSSTPRWEVYTLLLELEKTSFILDDLFTKDLPAIVHEARVLCSTGCEPSDPFILRSRCPTLWQHLSRIITNVTEIQRVAPVFDKANEGPFVGTWVQQVTNGMNGLSKEEWVRVDGDPTREDKRQKARFRFVVKLLMYSRDPRYSSVPDTVVEEMEKLGGPFFLLVFFLPSSLVHLPAARNIPMDTRPHADATIVPFSLHSLFNIWRTGAERGCTPSCKATYQLLLSLGSKLKRQDQFVSELVEHIIPEANSLIPNGVTVDAGAPNVLKTQCPVLWSYLSNLIRLEETQKVLLLDLCDKHDISKDTKAWIRGITFGSGALTKDEWEQRGGTKAQQESQNGARFQFLIKVIEGWKAGSSSMPKGVVDQMNELRGSFRRLAHDTEGRASLVRSSSTEKHSSTGYYSLGLTRRKSSIYFP